MKNNWSFFLLTISLSVICGVTFFSKQKQKSFYSIVFQIYLFLFCFIERLREISMQNRNTPQMLSRENRILERKVRVCKSHLELVNCLNNTGSNPRKSPKKRNHGQKLSAKIKSKLSTTTTPRKAYKVTSVWKKYYLYWRQFGIVFKRHYRIFRNFQKCYIIWIL